MTIQPIKTLNQWIVLGLAAGYATLFFDLRYDHNHVLQHHALAWIPIVHTAAMALVSLMTLALWGKEVRALMVWLSCAGIVVGILGFWLHNHGHPIHGIVTMLSVWVGDHPDPTKPPPVLAPLALAGLGLLGIATCISKTQPDSNQ